MWKEHVYVSVAWCQDTKNYAIVFCAEKVLMWWGGGILFEVLKRSTFLI
jgi:hypothetical protein